MPTLPRRLEMLLRWSERYTKTDMVYLFTGGSWLLFGQAASLLLSLLLAIVFGHYVSQDTYGNYKYVISLSGVLSAFALSGMVTAVGRAVARGKEGTLSQGFWLSLRYSGGVVVIGGIAALYYVVAHNIFVATSLVIVAVTTPFINSFSLYDAFFSGTYRFRESTLYMLASLAATNSALIATLLFFSKRAIVLVAVYFIVNLATDALWYAVARGQVSNDHADPELKRYGMHLSVLNLIDTVAGKIDSIAVFMILGPVQLAVYSFAIALPEQLRGVVMNLGKLTLPRFAARPFREIRGNTTRRLLALTIGITLVMGIYIALAPILFRYLFPLYLESVPYSEWYALAIIPTGVSTVLISLLQAHKKTRALYITLNTGALTLIVFLPFLTYRWGIAGAIAGLFISRTSLAGMALWQFLTNAET